jgi:polysaccharide export outer membrane protein
MTWPFGEGARVRPLLLLLLLPWLGGCVPGSGLPPLAPYDGTTYRLGVGDRVHITTFGLETLTGTFRVNDAGAIEMPLLGSVPAATLTPRALGAEIGADLSQRKLLNDPSVSVEVEDYRPIFVLGEVGRPGQYAYQPGMRVLTAVAIAGGYTYRAVQSHAQDLRAVDGTPHTGKVAPDDYVAPSDVITVLERYY